MIAVPKLHVHTCVYCVKMCNLSEPCIYVLIQIFFLVRPLGFVDIGFNHVIVLRTKLMESTLVLT